MPASSGEVVAFEAADGTAVWQNRPCRRTSRPPDRPRHRHHGDPVVLGSTVILGNQSGRTAAVSAEDGRRLWTANEGAYGPVLPAGNALFLINDEAQLCPPRRLLR